MSNKPTNIFVPRSTSLDTSDSDNTANFLPGYYKTDANKKFLHSTINQLTQPGTVKKVSGYIGRMTSKATSHDDVFITEPSSKRQNYQLEPGFTVNDTLDNIVYFKDYQDYVNQIQVFGGNTDVHSRLNKQEMYSWDPHIDWDKFIDFQNYYWLPNGPETVTVRKVKITDANSVYDVNISLPDTSYIFTPDGLTNNPTITLYRGQTYTFNIKSFGHLFSFKTARTTGILDRYISNTITTDVFKAVKDASGSPVIDVNGDAVMEMVYPITSGTIKFKVPKDAPNFLFYGSESNIDFSGIIKILDLADSADFDLNLEILGKKTYTLPNGTSLSNGMKVEFAGNVTPSKYASGRYYVEGVGTAIQLISEAQLEVVMPYTTSKTMMFDNELFDTTPFNDAISYSGVPDYIVINRGSRDKNFWSRNNRWIHKDVIIASSAYNGNQPDIDESMRAVRPIIEFEKNLKLFNFGTHAISDVASIDQYTVDVFSQIEGSLGYTVDQFPLVHGQHVIFTADTDVLVKNNIYRVDFVDVKHTTGSHTVSFVGEVTNVIPAGLGWKATIIGMTSTSGLDVGSNIIATTDTGNLGGVTAGSAVVTRVLSSTSVEYIVISESTPIPGLITNIINLIKGKQIHLVLVAKPVLNQVVLVEQGFELQGSMFWYDGLSWVKCQHKNTVNQVPYFDIVDENGISFGNKREYLGTTFKGTSVFSYKIGNGSSNDAALGFPLSYKNINNVGDIVFNFSLINDSFFYDNQGVTVSKTIDTGFLVLGNDTLEHVNAWKKCVVSNTQPAIRLYRNSKLVNNFKIDIFDTLPKLNDITVHVYVNNKRAKNWNFKSIANLNQEKFHEIVFNTNLTLSDTVMIKVYSNLPINSTGYYELPINLQNNPMNGVISEFTLGEVINHVDSIIDHIYYTSFNGEFPGVNNLRDIGNVTSYGTKFVQHSGSLGLSLYHLTSEQHNIIRAIDSARDDYCRFKRAFMTIAETLGVDTRPAAHVDKILQTLNKDTPATSSYYFSDMAPYGAKVVTNINIGNYTNKLFMLAHPFNLNELSNKAIGIYLNDVQLIHGREYRFNDQGFVEILSELKIDDTLSIYEYENTDGSFIPETPTKLGMWPKFEPSIYYDTTLITPKLVIQGHDGSITVAYGDYRDNLILELEKRIYNNLKTSYDPSIFNIQDVIPQYNYPNDYSLTEFNNALLSNYYKWSAYTGMDFSTPLSFNPKNPFTYVYNMNMSSVTPTFWRGIYQWMLGTDRPHLCPWEMLGFSIEPAWWTSVYGPAPYTSNNLVLWDDLSKGLVNEPNNPVVLNRYSRPFLYNKETGVNHIPVDETGNLRSPLESGIAGGTSIQSLPGDFTFGDVSPVEATWRRNSHYPFSVIRTSILLTPAKTLGVLIDRSRVKRNKIGQLIYTLKNIRLTLSDIVLPSIYLHKVRVQTAGLINYLVDYLNCDSLVHYTNYMYTLSSITPRITYRVSGFTTKEKFNLLLDSKSPLSTGSVFIPQEDYKIMLNKSSPISLITYSGVIITKVSNGYEIKGYSQVQPFFKYYKPDTATGRSHTIGGISEGYANWDTGKTYPSGTVVRFSNRYYRVVNTHTSATVFEYNNFAQLTSLPVTGGSSADFKNSWNKSTTYMLSYGTKLRSIQAVVDFLLGYGEWLKSQGFVFDQFNSTLATIVNWETSAKEFLFWTTQNWASSNDTYDTWKEWESNALYSYGEIVRYNGYYYKVLSQVRSITFNEDDYLLLLNLDLTGSSVLSVSPGASVLTYKTVYSVVDDIFNPNNIYEMLDGNGQPFSNHVINTYRTDNSVSYKPSTNSGIFCATFYLVQREHVVILNNTTMFNDTIYNPTSGYKQDKIKVSGYISSNWNGSLNVPGFIVDQAVINDWVPWKDYTMGDIVKYKSFYYSALMFIRGDAEFDDTQWNKLTDKPTPKMLPNWNYKATQFTDFYSLDSGNFDIGQQQMAQHLTGYQKRQYLENIIQDDVSEFKFYQGMIIEKGTQNVLNKLFDVLSADDRESLKFYEEWAIRVGQYGAGSSFENIEFILNESMFKSNPQGFELTNTLSNTSGTVIQQTVNDIYVKPVGYDPKTTWKKSKVIGNNAVYARKDEVNLQIKKLTDLLTTDITTVSYNDYILCTFDTNNEWNVYQFVLSSIGILSANQSNTLTQFESNISLASIIVAGDYIGIKSTTNKLINGFYQIIEVSVDDKFFKINYVHDISQIDIADLKIGMIIRRRAISIDYNNYTLGAVKNGMLLWTDNGIEAWKTWIYNTVYNSSTISIENTKIKQYGRDVAINQTGTEMVVSAILTTLRVKPAVRAQLVAQPPLKTIDELTDADYNRFDNGVILVYQRERRSSQWVLQRTLDNPFYNSAIASGDISEVNKVVAMSPDNKWIAAGSPHAGTNLQGVVSLYKKDANGIYNFEKNIQAETPTANEKFGFKLLFTTSSELLIGTVTKKIFKLSYNEIVNATASYNPNGSDATTLVISSTADILTDMLVKGKGFNSTHLVKEIVDSKEIILNVPPVSAPDGDIQFMTIHATTNYNPVGSSGRLLVVTSTEGIAVGMILRGNGFNNNQTVTSVENATTIRISRAPNYRPNEIKFVTFDVTATYNPVGSANTRVIVSSTAKILPNMVLVGEGFNGNQVVESVVDSNTVILYNEPISKPRGLLQFITYEWELSNTPQTEPNATNSYGSAIAVSNLRKLVVSDPGSNTVYVSDLNGLYPNSDVILSPETNAHFGNSVAISKRSDYVAISALETGVVSTGKVYIFKLSKVSNTHELVQTITNPDPVLTKNFGYKIEFTNNYTTLVISSRCKTADFNDNLTDTLAGVVDVYDMYESTWIFSERLTHNISSDGYGYTLSTTNYSIIVSAPYATYNNTQIGLLYEYVKPATKFSWEVKNYAIDRPDVNKIKQAFLYNRTSNTLVKYLDVIDPVHGKHPKVADQEIKFKSPYDPAVYSYSTGSVTVNVDSGIAWASENVGSLWWDERTVKFVDNFTDNVLYRNSTLSMLAYGSTIDIYEWIETKLLPDDWDAEADTITGLAAGISGRSIYGNAAYTEIKRYDTIGRRFIYTYYYWVKNKKTVPNLIGRSISAYDVSNLIANPMSQGYECLSLTGLNSFSLINVKGLLIHSDIVLSVEYWTTDKTDQNIHTQWKLISDAPLSTIPTHIEQKWIDSLCGKDLFNRLIPDPILPMKLRYGIENRPRQGMFVNRFEALKQIIEQTNLMLATKLVVDLFDLTLLQDYHKNPSVSQGMYDVTVDTYPELEFESASYFVQPKVRPVIEDGRIIDIIIDTAGRGYVNAPYINVLGAGRNAIVKSVIDSMGRITGCDIVNAGEGYVSATTVMSIRPYCGLVSSDINTNNSWCIYSYDINSDIWSKVQSQTFDVTKYWKTIDWYDTGYSKFTNIDYTVDTYTDLNSITTKIGNTVKVSYTSTNRWILLKKYNDSTNYDWSYSYKVIGSQSGTIQFSKLLYDFKNSPIGYDGTLYDSDVYDNCASIELRIILTAIKDKLLTSEEYSQLFFTGVRYAMSEQTYIDWIFKTSFINVTHNVGKLRQLTTYKNDNLSNFEDYIAEVKPYRTQIREYISSYDNIDESSTAVSDFDLPAVYDRTYNKLITVNTIIKNDVLIIDNPAIQRYPWKAWRDNVGFSIDDLKLVDGGSEYIEEPYVKIISNSGKGAIARAFIANGKVTRVKILNPGSGYLSTPIVEITGGITNKGTDARVVAYLGNGVVRSNLTKIKFDRITQSVLISDLSHTDTLVDVSGSRVQFSLSWAPDLHISKSTVVINGAIEIRDNYKMQVVVNSQGNYSGIIVFNVAPTAKSVITVTYVKNVALLNAVDRIEHFYNPKEGDIGKDFAQLMTGMEYGGVGVSGLPFAASSGWGSTGFSTAKWDSTASLTNYKVTIPKDEYRIILPYIPEDGEILNIYYDNGSGAQPIRIDDPNFGIPADPDRLDLPHQSNENAIMLTPKGTGDNPIVEIPKWFTHEHETYTFIVRNQNSDGSEETNEYDISLNGGTFNQLSASGLLPEDIIVDGDKFDTNFPGPEEVVPGQVVDTLAIKVFTNNSAGAFMQFKDMLNRVYFKRLSFNKQTKLAKPLAYTDKTITVTDTSKFESPDPTINVPGVIYVNGERIEFFTISSGNVLGQLRRGTFGTGVPLSHAQGSYVHEIGTTETVPYTESSTLYQAKIADSTVIVKTADDTEYGESIIVLVPFVPRKTHIKWTYTTGIPLGYGQCDDIEVYIGGYDYGSPWVATAEYFINDVVTIGSYVYKCVIDHISSASFNSDFNIDVTKSKWVFFVGNIRLQKQPYVVYNEKYVSLTNPTGAKQFPADFSVNGKFKEIRISNTFNLAQNTVITVVKKTGTFWTPTSPSLVFIKSVKQAEVS